MNTVNRLNDLDTLIAIGMFTAKELEGYICEGLQHLIAVIPLPEHAESIRIAFFPQAGATKITVIEGVLAKSEEAPGTHLTYQTYNLAEANGFKEPTHLKAIYPGLRAVSSVEVETLGLAKLLKLANTALESLGRTGVAIFGQGLEQEIYAALNNSEMLTQVVALDVRLPQNKVFENALTEQALIALLENDGFTINSVSDNQEAFQHWQFSKHPLFDKLIAANKHIQALEDKLAKSSAQLEEEQKKASQFKAEQQSKLKDLQQELSDYKKASEDTSALNDTLKTELKGACESRDNAKKHLEQAEERIQRLTTEKNKIIEKFEESDKRRKKLKSELESLKTSYQEHNIESDKQVERIKYLKQQVQQLEERLAEGEAQKSELGALKEHMDYLFGQSTLQLEQAANALGKHVTTTSNTTRREIESNITLQSTYGEHLSRLTDASSSLSKSEILAISEKLNQSNYDVIIEFGFSEKTLLIAELIKAKSAGGDNGARLIGNDKISVSYDIDEVDSFDLPHRIVSFEHSKEAYKAALAKIEKQDLESLVTVVYSPLINSVYSEDGGLIHDAEQDLRRLANVLQSQESKILVVLSSENSKYSLYPVLSLMLQVLGRHSLEIITCGSPDTLEKLLKQGWEDMLIARTKSYQLERTSNLLQSLVIN